MLRSEQVPVTTCVMVPIGPVAGQAYGGGDWSLGAGLAAPRAAAPTGQDEAPEPQAARQQ